MAVEGHPRQIVGRILTVVLDEEGRCSERPAMRLWRAADIWGSRGPLTNGAGSAGAVTDWLKEWWKLFVSTRWLPRRIMHSRVEGKKVTHEHPYSPVTNHAPPPNKNKSTNAVKMPAPALSAVVIGSCSITRFPPSLPAVGSFLLVPPVCSPTGPAT